MSQGFKIRKNKSQKQIQNYYEQGKKSPLLQPYPHHKHKISNHNSYKITHLQPLLKTKVSLTNQNKSGDIKLDFTQPIPHRWISNNKQEHKYDGPNLTPLEINLQPRHPQLDKQNRPHSNNELKYPTIAKVQSNLLKTDKYQTMKVLSETSGVLSKTRSQKENGFQTRSKAYLPYKMSKMNLMKSNSKSKMAKIGAQTQQQNHIVYQEEVQTQPDMHSYRTFRKGIINKIFCQSKNVVNQLKKIEEQRQNHEDTARIEPKHKQKEIDQEIGNNSINSPILKKDTTLNWANCSTIKEQEESCSSFISKGAIEDFVVSKNVCDASPVFDHKGDRRKKAETDRIKKKFPENFFK